MFPQRTSHCSCWSCLIFFIAPSFQCYRLDATTAKHCVFFKHFWGHCLINVWYEGQWGQYCDIAARKSWTLLQTFPCERNGDHILPSFVKTSIHRLCLWSFISIFCHTVIFFLHSQQSLSNSKIHFKTKPISKYGQLDTSTDPLPCNKISNQI